MPCQGCVDETFCLPQINLATVQLSGLLPCPSIVSSLGWTTSTVSAMVSALVAYLFWVSNSSEEPSLRMRYKPGARDPGFPDTS